MVEGMKYGSSDPKIVPAVPPNIVSAPSRLVGVAPPTRKCRQAQAARTLDTMFQSGAEPAQIRTGAAENDALWRYSICGARHVRRRVLDPVRRKVVGTGIKALVVEDGFQADGISAQDLMCLRAAITSLVERMGEY